MANVLKHRNLVKSSKQRFDEISQAGRIQYQIQKSTLKIRHKAHKLHEFCKNMEIWVTSTPIRTP